MPSLTVVSLVTTALGFAFSSVRLIVLAGLAVLWFLYPITFTVCLLLALAVTFYLHFLR